jgi:Fic family protein
MKSFLNDHYTKQNISLDLLATIRLIGQYNGKEELYKQQTPQILDALRQTAIIHSTESSNRIEGITVSEKRLKELVGTNENNQPRTRSEQEIAGYRAVLDLIHTYHDGMPFSTGLVRQLHRDLYQFSPGRGGEWKNSDNFIKTQYPDGTENIRFKPISAHQTPEAMEDLHKRLNDHWDRGITDPLILIPTYILDFLCIHPFNDGNGRMARLLSLLLLYKAGYNVGRYISLEKIVETTKESYYETLYISSQRWHEGAHDLRPWWNYFLGVMLLTAYREFETRIHSAGRADKRELVMNIIDTLPMEFKVADIERQATTVSRPTIHRALAQLKEEGKIVCIKGGRGAIWGKVQS